MPGGIGQHLAAEGQILVVGVYARIVDQHGHAGAGVGQAICVDQFGCGFGQIVAGNVTRAHIFVLQLRVREDRAHIAHLGQAQDLRSGTAHAGDRQVAEMLAGQAQGLERADHVLGDTAAAVEGHHHVEQLARRSIQQIGQQAGLDLRGLALAGLAFQRTFGLGRTHVGGLDIGVAVDH